MPPYGSTQKPDVDVNAETLAPENAAGTTSLTLSVDTHDAAAKLVAGAPPPSIPGYEFQEELGRGGMGVVYKAIQTRLHRTVAVKMILSGEYASADARIRFLVEAELIARIVHPTIVQLHEFNVHDGIPYFALEFVDGGTLAKKLSGQPLPPPEAAALVETLARGVQVAHEAGIVHRDLKPGNILLQTRPDHDSHLLNRPSGMHRSAHGDASFGTLSCVLLNHTYVPKITDFGLAKSVGNDTGLTASGAIMGTPSYMAPEQAGGKSKTVGTAADTYSLGAILYEALTGRPPFRADNALDTVLQVVNHEPVPPRRLQPKIPRDLETICLKCLQKDPARRYASALDLAEDLARFLNDEAILARPVGKAERVVRWAKRKPAAAALVAVGTLAATVILVGGWLTSASLSSALVETDRQRFVAERARVEADKQRQAALDQTAVAEANAAAAARQEQLVAASLRTRLEGVEKILMNFDKRLEEEDLSGVRRDLLDELRTLTAQLLAENPDDATARRQAGRIEFSLATLERTAGRAKQADGHYKAALEHKAKLASQYPTRTDYRYALALSTYGRAHNDLKDKSWEKARAGFADAVALYDAVGNPLEFPEAPVRSARARFYGANALEELKKPKEAIAMYRAAVALLEERVKANAANADAREDLGLALTGLGYALEATAPDETYTALLRAVEEHRKSAQLSPRTRRYATNARDAFDDIYDFCQLRNRDADLAAMAQSYADDPTDRQFASYNAACYFGLAVKAVQKHPALAPEEKAARAEKYGAKAVAYLHKTIDDGSNDRAHMLVDRDLEAIRGRADYKEFLAMLDRRFQGRPVTPADLIGDLQDEFVAMDKKSSRLSGSVVTVADRKRALRRKPDFAWYAGRILEIAAANERTQAAVDGISWTIMWSKYVSAKQPSARAWMTKALKQLAPAVARPEFLGACYGLGHYWSPEGDALLREAAENHPDRVVRGVATYSLGLSLAGQFKEAVEGSPKQADFAAQAEASLDRAEKEFTAVQYEKSSLGALAKKKLVELRSLSVGRAAREIDGRDLLGKPMKLSQFRGKVTLVVFWANWCGPCRKFLPSTREWAETYALRPFAVVGINGDDEKEAVARTVAAERIAWPSFDDSGSAGGQIFNQWMVSPIPSAYLIDHAGIIRGKWDGGVEVAEIAAQIATLVAKAEGK